VRFCAANRRHGLSPNLKLQLSRSLANNEINSIGYFVDPGAALVNPQDRQRVIEQWMMQVSRDGGIARFDDLHVDAIDPLWKKRELWAEACRRAFQSDVEVRDKLGLPLTVALGMSLRSDSVVMTSGVRLAELISLLDWTPPSLYLFFRGQEPGTDLESAISSGRIEADSISAAFIAVDMPNATSGMFLRFRRTGSVEFTTSAFLLGWSLTSLPSGRHPGRFCLSVRSRSLPRFVRFCVANLSMWAIVAIAAMSRALIAGTIRKLLFFNDLKIPIEILSLFCLANSRTTSGSFDSKLPECRQ
jgi:hypothetical protein